MVSNGADQTVKARSRWRCKLCSKSLSSKRSYDEHMNVHNDARPFACDECRRHKLRNHAPRSAWGYQCPHCPEIYMEPASYQQHASSRHPGMSYTFGCPFCQFSTLSSKHFREHYTKHTVVIARHTGIKADESSFNLADNLIHEDLDPDFFKAPLKRRVPPASETVETKPNIRGLDIKPEEAACIKWVQSEVTIDDSGGGGSTLTPYIKGFVDQELD